jgi:phospholipid/cholesterol/gamma-HCH transport system substrate-binding protein
VRLRTSRHEAKTIAKFAVFAAICMVLAVYIVIKLGNLYFGSTSDYSAVLSDATGLSKGDPVKIAGIRSGTVNSIKLDHGAARVGFSLDKSVQMRTATQAGLRWRNVIGQKDLYVYPGNTGRTVGPGYTIPESQTFAGADIGAFLNAAGPLLKAINPNDANSFVQGILGALQGNQAQVTGLLGNSAQLSSALGASDTQVGSIIDNMSQVLSSLAARNGDINTLIGNLNQAGQMLAANNDNLDTAISDFGQLASQLGNLFATNRGNLDATINSLQSITDVLSQHHSDLLNGLNLLSNVAAYANVTRNGQYFQGSGLYVCASHEQTCIFSPAPNAPGSSSPPQSSAAASPAATGSTSSNSLPMPGRGQVAQQQPTIADFLRAASSGGA